MAGSICHWFVLKNAVCWQLPMEWQCGLQLGAAVLVRGVLPRTAPCFLPCTTAGDLRKCN